MKIKSIFVSPKQPSLFPMTIQCPDISTEDYHLFYKHERRLFTMLLVILRQEILQSLLVLGFLIWLEREAYTSKNLVQIVIDSLSLGAVNQVIDEVVICLKCIQKGGNAFLFEGSSAKHDISLLNGLLDRKRICLKKFHENRDYISDQVSCIANDVYGKAFNDIVQQLIIYGIPSTMVSTKEVIAGSGARGYPYLDSIVQDPSYKVSNYIGFHPEFGFPANQDWSRVTFGGVNSTLPTQKMDFRQHKDLSLNAPLIIREQEQEIPPDDRTIFLTFSKGYPISEAEVRDYFTRNFGDFIEAIHMHDVGPDEQALYARIVSCSPSTVTAITEKDGPEGKSKYNINGKHVWARKYVKKKPIRVSSTQLSSTEVKTPPQP